MITSVQISSCIYLEVYFLPQNKIYIPNPPQESDSGSRAS